LDAGDEPAFQYVNRPHPSLSFRQVVEGLVQFREEYKGQVWLEVLLAGGVTTTASEVSKIKEHAERIQPDRIQLNTVVRPAAEDFAFPVQPAELDRVHKLFGERAEVIASFPTRSRTEQFEARRDEVLSLLSRRPCSVEDIANGMMLNKNQLIKCLDDLLSKGLIDYTYRNGRVYYVKGGDQS
jgi:wyosine [tRNA(Phe)-imidazoG37] synthetase (radical SAM superfamily)